MKIVFTPKPGPCTGMSLIVILTAATQLLGGDRGASWGLGLLAGNAYGQLRGPGPATSA